MKHCITLFTALSLSVLGVCGQTSGYIDDEALIFGYCGDYASSLGSNNPDIKVEKGAIEIPTELAQSWKGAKITKVDIGYGVSSESEITVFFSESLDSEPFYTQNAVMNIEGGWNTVVLDNPVEVEGNGFFVGYSTNVNSPADKPIGMDDIKNTNPYCAFINTYNEWESVGKFYGSVCIRLALIGDELPQYSLEAFDLSVPELVELRTPFDAVFSIKNEGLKTIENLELECHIAGEKAESQLIETESPVISGETVEVTLRGLVCETAGKDLKLEVEIVKINGNENESPSDNILSTTFNCAEKTYPQQVVVEEFTGTWCGFCPLGIVGMGYMQEKYGKEGFNGIAIHNGDPMQVGSYVEFADKITGGNYPSAFLNRRLFFLEPSKDVLEELYLEAVKTPAPAGVELEATYFPEENQIYVTSKTEFSFDEEDAEYSMAYVIIENNMGPYTQTNYFADGANGGLEGWSNLPGKAENIYYNEVARFIETTYGIPESIPASITARTPYSWEARLSCNDVEKINECEVIALLIDTESGAIVNSAKAELSNEDAGVGSVINGLTSGTIKVYNLQGVKVLETKNISEIMNLGKGLYIINGKKILL